MHFLYMGIVNADPHPSDTFGSNAKRRNRLSRHLDAGKIEGEPNCKDAMIAIIKLHSRDTEETQCLLSPSQQTCLLRITRELVYLERCKVAVGVRRWHSHGLVLWWGRSRSVGSSGGARIVLRASPGKTDTGVANWITLHLVDGHLSGVALDKLDKAAALSGRDLYVGDFAEALEEGTEFILGDVARETSNENGRVVGIRELVHGLRSTIIS